MDVVRRSGPLAVAIVALAGAFAQAAFTPQPNAGAIQTVRGTDGHFVKLNTRTIDMLGEAERYLAAHGGCDPARARPSNIVQGSYNKGGVAASAGTHDGGGVIDVRCVDISIPARRALAMALRHAGFAAWIRHPPLFPYHIHAVAVGDPSMSPAARQQVTAYFNGRDGLAHNGPDELGGPIILPWMRGGAAPSGGGSSSGTPTLQLGTRSAAVSTLQTILKQKGFDPGPADGYFGPQTLAAVKGFQKANGLLVDGVVGPHTWAKLKAGGGSATSGGGGTSAAMPTLKRGSQGAAVKTLQTLLKQKGFHAGPVDGDFGPVTEAAVRSFQKAKKLVVDGVVGPVTWTALR